MNANTFPILQFFYYVATFIQYLLYLLELRLHVYWHFEVLGTRSSFSGDTYRNIESRFIAYQEFDPL